MEDLRITTPRKQTRLVISTKKPKPQAGFFSRVANALSPNKRIKSEAQLHPDSGAVQGVAEEPANDADEDEEAAARRRVDKEAGEKPKLLNHLLPGSSKGKYTVGPGEARDGTGQQPFAEGSVTWSEDKSRAASDVGDNLVDMMMTNPGRLAKEPPVFFDPVEDQVRSRWLAVLAMCAFPTILATILLVDVWDNSALFTRDARPSLSLLYRSGDPFIVGRQGAANLSLKVLVTNFYDWPLRDRNVTASITGRQLSPAVLRRLPFCADALAGTAHARAARQVCEYALEGATAASDRDGVAILSDLAIAAALPGAYRLRIGVEGSGAELVLWVQVRAQVSALLPAGDAAATHHRWSATSLSFSSGSVPLPLASPAPAVQVVAASPVGGSADLAGLPVIAIAVRPRSDLDGELRDHFVLSSTSSQPVRPDPVVVLGGNVVATDSQGRATFSGLSVVGFDSPNLLLAFVCQGEVLVWSEVSPPAAQQRGLRHQGQAQIPTLAMTALTPPPAVTEAARLAGGGVRVSGLPRTVREGEAASVQITLPEAMRGVALIGRAVPAESALAMAEREEQGVAGGGVASVRFKQLVNSAVIFSGGTSFGATFSFSRFGAVGDYLIELVAMGTVAATVGPVNVTSSVGVALLTLSGSSQVVCGRQRYPLCQHLDGACSFGPVAGNELRELPDGAECSGMEVMVEYGGQDQLPWAELVGTDSKSPVPNKQVRMLAVPWSGSNAADGNQTAGESDGLVSVSWPAGSSSAFGAVSFGGIKVLVSAASSAFVQLAISVDGNLRVLPIRVALRNNVAEAEARCGGTRACALIRVLQRIPRNVTAGIEMTPSPSAMVVDGEGRPLAGQVVCLAFGTEEEVEAETGGVAGTSAVSSTLAPSIVGNASAESIRGQASAVTVGCAASGADGIAVLSGVLVRSLPTDQMTVWRFYSPNVMTSSQAGCLAFSGVWASGCRSPLHIAHVHNPVSWIAVTGGPSAALALYLGNQAIEVQANSTENASVTAFRLAVACHKSDGTDTSCRHVSARVQHWWNSNAGRGTAQCGFGGGNLDAAWAVRVTRQSFSETESGGELDVELNSGLAGTHVMELSSWGVSSSVVVIARHRTAATLVQLADLNAARDGNYSACTFDCDARNVSNLGRLHPQQIRVAVMDADGNAVFHSQVHASLVDIDGNPQPGQLTGTVSEPLRTDPSTGEPYAAFPCLALTAVAPGTYRFQLALHGPEGESNSASPAPILTAPFSVYDRVEVSVSQHPPAVIGGAVRSREWAVEPDVVAKVAATLRIRRWEGHTSFMYKASCLAPVVQVDLGVVKTSDVPSQQLVAGDWWVVEAGAAGRTVLRSDPSNAALRRPDEALWNCWGVSEASTARFDSVLAVAAPGHYCLALSGVGLEANAASGLPEWSGVQRVCSRPFALGVRPVGVYLLSEWDRRHVGIGETFSAELQLVGPVGAVLEGHVIEAAVDEDCGLPDGSCAARGAFLSAGAGVAVTDTSGRARMELVMGAGRPGWYRFKFRCSGVQSLVSTPIHVRGRVAGIQIVEELVGVSELERVPARPLGSYEFGGVQELITVAGVHTVTGDLSAYLSLQLPKVRVVDEYGSALYLDSEVELHLVTCGQKSMQNGTVPYPPTGECEEFVEFESLTPIFSCSSVRGCDVGSTRFPQIQFESTTKTGFYYVFFAVQGVVVMQRDPLFIRNSLIPADSTITTFRLCILVAVFGMILLFNANLVYRARFWCQVSLLGCGIFCLITILYGNALLNKYGDPTKVPPELVASATLMVLNALGLTVILTRLVLQSDSAQYFTSRQDKYLLALRGLLVSRPDHAQHAPAHGRRPPLRGRNKVHPSGGHAEKKQQLDDGQKPTGTRAGLRFRGGGGADKAGEGQGEGQGVGQTMSRLAHMFSRSAAAAAAAGRATSQEVLSGFAYPSRLYQGFGMSAVGVIILLVFCQSMVNSMVYNIELLRAEVVAYRGALGMWKTSTDQASDLAAVPVPPYADSIDVSALTFSLMEAIYPDGPALFEGLVRSVEQGSAVGSTAICVSFCWSWLQTFRVYRSKMLQLRADRSLIDHFKFPIHEAAGYIGRQLWASVVSALLVYLPVMFGVQLCVWGPTQRFFLVYLALPIAGLTVIEALSYAARQAVNRLAVSGSYIRNRRLFGWYDFIGLYLHFISGSSLAILRMLLTYVDFAVNFARLDLPVFEGSLQNLDPGHASFMAMLYLDYVYNSPITSVLATNLANAMRIRRMKNEMMQDDVRPEQQAMLKQAANERNQRNRWQLLFTITRNVAMKQYRVPPPPPRNAWDSDDEGSVSSGASERRAKQDLEEQAAVQKKGRATR